MSPSAVPLGAAAEWHGQLNGKAQALPVDVPKHRDTGAPTPRYYKASAPAPEIPCSATLNCFLKL